MRHPAVSGNLYAKGAFGSYGNFVFGRLAINEEPAAQRTLIGHLGAEAVPLFAHQEKHSNGCTIFAQALTGANLCRHNAFCIARAAPINVFAVFR